jgi:hypothetical protein
VKAPQALHDIDLDTNGLFTGVKNQDLEVFPNLSKASDAKDTLGNSNYYKNYIFNNSNTSGGIDETLVCFRDSFVLVEVFKLGKPFSCVL